jgi:hypothetical protein
MSKHFKYFLVGLGLLILVFIVYVVWSAYLVKDLGSF